jgi:hypothetical protein
MMSDDATVGIHALVLHPPPDDSWLAQARDRDGRVNLGAGIVELVSAFEERSIITFPAGYLTAANVDGAFALAERMLKIASANRVGLVFGVRIAGTDSWAPLDPTPAYLGFACDGGRRASWPISDEEPVVTLRGHRVGVLVGREPFDRKRRATVAEAKPEVILALTNSGANGRWSQVLRLLHAIAPTIVVGQSTTGAVPDWAAAPENWVRHDLSATSTMTLVKYEPLLTPMALYHACAPAVGDVPGSVKD